MRIDLPYLIGVSHTWGATKKALRLIEKFGIKGKTLMVEMPQTQVDAIKELAPKLDFDGKNAEQTKRAIDEMMWCGIDFSSTHTPEKGFSLPVLLAIKKGMRVVGMDNNRTQHGMILAHTKGKRFRPITRFYLESYEDLHLRNNRFIRRIKHEKDVGVILVGAGHAPAIKRAIPSRYVNSIPLIQRVTSVPLIQAIHFPNHVARKVRAFKRRRRARIK
ncbi:MAG: hypothetical protein IPJ89_05060 [Candidatus Iainarchaeum archaeon]|uniref:Uncharacterized protein n=1 Tax=Candidatus Iainarchaeum sp. TaxID=3101447 RepID=A0A7T9DJK6_9ARCH|nr:MAG: hypothetical protein IPJ89_05060 [Candidatus Diapherotrites archaeon]